MHVCLIGKLKKCMWQKCRELKGEIYKTMMRKFNNHFSAVERTVTQYISNIINHFDLLGIHKTLDPTTV